MVIATNLDGVVEIQTTTPEKAEEVFRDVCNRRTLSWSNLNEEDQENYVEAGVWHTSSGVIVNIIHLDENGNYVT